MLGEISSNESYKYRRSKSPNTKQNGQEGKEGQSLEDDQSDGELLEVGATEVLVFENKQSLLTRMLAGKEPEGNLPGGQLPEGQLPALPDPTWSQMSSGQRRTSVAGVLNEPVTGKVVEYFLPDGTYDLNLGTLDKPEVW